MYFSSDGVTVADAKQNYLDHEKEMIDLVSYFQQICPKSKRVTFNLEGEHGVEIWIMDTADVDGPHRARGGEYDSQSDIIQSCLKELNWTAETVDTLSEKLESANCYYIFENDHIQIGYHQDDVCAIYYSFDYHAIDPARLEEIRQTNQDRILNDSTIVCLSCIL